MSRKTYGALLGDLDGNYNNFIWSEILRAAGATDDNLVVFEGRDIDDPGTDLQHNIVYGLARRFACDGYILLSTQITGYVDRFQYQDFCRPFLDWGVPVVSIGFRLPGAISLLIDNKTGLRALIEHLIVYHSYRRIAFIKGPDAHEEAIERYEVYLEMLEKHGIPFDPRLVQSGDFSPVEGFAAYARLNATGLPIDCVVCANDETAMGVYRYLRKRSTQDTNSPVCFVTGFDNTQSAQLSKPSMTTVAQPFNHIADEAFARLASPVGLPGGDTVIFPTELIVRESCGCHAVSTTEFSDELFVRATRNYRVHQTMQTFSLEELYNQITNVLSVCGIQDCFVVKYAVPVTYPRQSDVPEQAELLYARIDGRRLQLREPVPFSTDRLLPEYCFPDSHRATWIVKPLFFKDEHLGYMVIEPIDNDARNFESVRGQISNTLKVALLLIRQKEIEDKLQVFNQKLNLLSVRDELSGLYNRRGFFEAATAILGKPENIAEDSLVIFADIDGMKKINDTYGHAEGDVAILTTTHILTSVFRGEDIVARMGGDEFVVLAKTLSESYFPIIQERIARMLQEYNRTSGKPYRLDFSLGHASFGVQKRPNLEELLKIADERLYIEKRRRRALSGEEQDAAIPV